MKGGKFEALMLHILSSLNTSIYDFCDLETTSGQNNIIAKDGTIISIAEFDGARGIVGNAQFDEFVENLTQTLEPYFRARGHQLQVVFMADDDPSEVLDKNARIKHAVAQQLTLDIHDIIREEVDKYCGYTHDEKCYLVFYSRPSLLDSQEIKGDAQERNDLRAAVDWPSAPGAQNILRPIGFLTDRHQAFVNKVCSDLGSPRFGCSVQIVDCSKAINIIRRSAFPDYTSDSWRPAIPSKTNQDELEKRERMVVRWKEGGDPKDASEYLYPSLPQQIMVSDALVGDDGQSRKNSEKLNDTIVRVGSRYFAPLMVLAPPRDPKFFTTLFDAICRSGRDAEITRSMPFAMSFMLEGDGMGMLGLRSVFANVLGVTSEKNRNISAASKALSEWSRDGGVVVKLRMMCMTWAPATPEGKELIQRRKQTLWRCMEGWGSPMISEVTGDSMKGFQSCLPGITVKNIGTPCPAPLQDALMMMPFARPASPFNAGTIIYRSRDGKVLRYQKFSSEQTTWITLLAGKPGSGKSVLMNSNNVESCLAPGLKNLPWICIIDIGISSSGFVDLIRDALPDDKKHLALYERLQNTKEYAINPLDTALGQRHPLPSAREFIKNFITMLVTSPEREGKPLDGMSNFVSRIIDKTYEDKNDAFERASPYYYRPGQNEIIDKGIKQLRDGEVNSATTNWSLVDRFFKAGMLYEAEVTQRYAVPTLDDLVQTANSEAIMDEYKNITTDGGRDLIQAFTLGVREAVSDFPCFSSATNFDVGPSRVMSLDLQDVALQGSPSATKQTSLMYMIARQLFTKKVGFSREDLAQITPLYREYFTQIIDRLIDEPKILCMDEFHKTGGHEMLRRQVETDGREARKWNMEIILASQLMEDFGSLSKIATTIFILDSGTTQTQQWLRENVGLSDEEEEKLRSYVHGANKHGACFMARFVTNKSTYTQLFTATMGSARLWALSTTAEDRKLRTLLYDAMPKTVARKILAQKFPSGSCKRYIEEQRLNNLGMGGKDEDDSAIEKLGKELISEWYRSGGNLT